MEANDPQELASRIAGWGADADASRRPGVPFPDLPPRRRPGAPYDQGAMPRQQADVEVLIPPERKGQPTPVFGTAAPPRLLSGAIKRLAYRYPDHLTRRWMLLLLSDRVDVVEGKVERVVMPGVALGVALGCMVFLKRVSARY